MSKWTDILLSKIQTLLGERGNKADHAVRWRDLTGGLPSSGTGGGIVIGGSASDPRVDNLITDVDSLEQQVASAQQAADLAALDALTADNKAQAVRDDHDALVAGFTGTLAAAFAGIEGDLTSITADLSAFYDDATQQIKATALTGYYTKDGTNGAISAAIDSFESEFRNPVNGQIKATALTGYYTSAQTDSAISAVQTTLSASISAVNASVQGWQLVTDQVADVTAGAAVTVTQGASALGQAGTIIVAEGAVGRDTSGFTNGASLKIPTERAIIFAGQRVKIGVLARAPSANAAKKFGIAYSTFDTGSSGYMVASAGLTTGWKWFTFYYDVPQAAVGGADYIGIFGDDGKTGKATEIARVYVEIAAVAGELPEIGTLSGQITDILGLDISPTSALATSITQLQASVTTAQSTANGKGKIFFQTTAPPVAERLAQNLWIDTTGGANTPKRWSGSAWVAVSDKAATDALAGVNTLSATVTTQGSAIADLEGNASAGYLIRAQAGGAVSLIDLVAADGSGLTPSSFVRIKADDILLDGSVSMRKLVVHDNSAVFSEVFDSTAALAEWQNYAGSGELSIVSTAYAKQGGKVLRVGNNAGNDMAWYVARTLIPFDPDRTYRIRAGVRRNSGTGSIYLGFVGVAADGVTLVNNNGANSHTAQFYAPSGAQSPPLSTYTEITGYAGGVGSGGVGTLASPRLIHANVRYLRPVIIVNYEDVAGQTLVDYVKVDTVSDATLIADGAIATEKIVAGAITTAKIAAGSITAASGIIADAAISNAKIANGAITTAKIGDLQVNTIKIANNAITSLVATEISSGSPSFTFTAPVGTYAVVFATFQVAIYKWTDGDSNADYYDYNVTLNGKSIGRGHNWVKSNHLNPFWESFSIPVEITQSSNTITVTGATVSSSSKVRLGALKVLK